MAGASVFVLLCFFQVTVWAHLDEISVQEVESKASAIVQQARARSQVVILTNQLLTNATLITHSAEGNASMLLANLNNEINKGIADAQAKATQIGNSFQGNLSKEAESVKNKAAAIYTLVESSLRNATNHVEETIIRILSNTETELTKTLDKMKSNLSLAAKTLAVTETADATVATTTTATAP